MNILHLAAGNRWTGAAAPAFAEVVALREAGVNAHYAYVGGYRLEAKIGRYAFAHAVIEKAQNPFAFARSVRALRRLIDEQQIDVVHAHLTYDHWLARFAVRGTKARVARTFHARRVLRTDPFSRHLLAHTSLVFVINEAFRNAAALHGRDVVFTPPPLDLEQFTPEGADARAMYGLDRATKLVTVIGKLSKGRGFEEALQTFAVLRTQMPGVRMMIIGHGEHRPALEALAASLGITNDVTWAGYHEVDLAEHYRASDVLLFTAKGSDEGHRAVLEAMACGVPVATYPIEGVSALVPHGYVAPDPSPEALAGLTAAIMRGDLHAHKREVASHARQFGYRSAAERLIDAYSR